MKSTSDMLLVVHVPKTAGTSLRRALDKTFGVQYVIRDYGGHEKTTSDIVRSHLYSNEIPNTESLMRSMLKADAKVLIGHFPAKKYVSFFKPEHVIVFVRDPLERACSEFLHWVRHHSYESTFEQFIQQKDIANIQSKLLHAIPKQAIIGITERYAESLQYINCVLGIGLKELKKNVDKSGGGSEFASKLSQAQLDLFYELNQRDVELYDSCSQRFCSLEIPEAPNFHFRRWLSGG